MTRNERERRRQARRTAREIAVRVGWLRRCGSCGDVYVDQSSRVGETSILAEGIRRRERAQGKHPLASGRSRSFGEVVAEAVADSRCRCGALIPQD